MLRVFLLPALLLSYAAHAEEPADYIEVRPGTMPIILTVPHGGTLRPDEFKTRLLGKLAQDSNTIQLSTMLSEELQRLYGGTPHMVICRLHRSKLDCNRELVEAAQDDPLAIAAWKRYHEATDVLRKQVTQRFGTGLLLDMHGHRHEEGLVELGYLLSGKALEGSDEGLNVDAARIAQTSVRELDQRSRQSFAELIRGPQSLGTLVQERGHPALPSQGHPAPNGGEYFTGNYTVAAHGSREGGTISAIQVESPWEGVRDTPENQRHFAKALAEALGVYFQMHFQTNLRVGAP